ncbi:MAG: hypothetical protein WDW38_011057 [Sanguina aurantia]
MQRRPGGSPSHNHTELRQALAGAEKLLLFGSSQTIRTEALFHAGQLRQGLADLKRYDRREAAAAAVYQNKALQDARDADGTRHKATSRQAAALQAAAKAALSRQQVTRHQHQTAPTARRAGIPNTQTFTVVHPDWDSQPWREPGVTWRPSATTSRSKPPRNNTTSAGEYVAYDYDKDLAKTRSLRVDDLKAFLRQEKRWQAGLQQLLVEQSGAAAVAREVLPGFDACRGVS